MLTYETLFTQLLQSVEQQQLGIAFSQEQIDPHTLLRNFSITCLAPGIVQPNGLTPHAQISFRWDAALSAISLHGSGGMCDLYHSPEEECTHQKQGCAYEAMLDLEALYEIPLSEEQAHDISGVVGIAAGLRELLASAVGHDDDLEVRVQIIFDQFDSYAARLEAFQRWTIEEELHDPELLGELLAEVCGEVSAVLGALSSDEPPHLMTDDDDEGLSASLTYLRPPTA